MRRPSTSCQRSTGRTTVDVAPGVAHQVRQALQLDRPGGVRGPDGRAPRARTTSGASPSADSGSRRAAVRSPRGTASGRDTACCPSVRRSTRPIGDADAPQLVAALDGCREARATCPSRLPGQPRIGEAEQVAVHAGRDLRSLSGGRGPRPPARPPRGTAIGRCVTRSPAGKRWPIAAIHRPSGLHAGWPKNRSPRPPRHARSRRPPPASTRYTSVRHVRSASGWRLDVKAMRRPSGLQAGCSSTLRPDVMRRRPCHPRTSTTHRLVGLS